MRFVFALIIMFIAFPVMAFEKLNPVEARNLALAGKAVLIDVRTPAEWKQSGIGDVAMTADMSARDFGQKLNQIIAAHSNKKLAFICATGARSAYLARALESYGLKNIADVTGGMMGNGAEPGWIKRGLPIKK